MIRNLQMAIMQIPSSSLKFSSTPWYQTLFKLIQRFQRPNYMFSDFLHTLYTEQKGLQLFPVQTSNQFFFIYLRFTIINIFV